jgi:hypothetical protein
MRWRYLSYLPKLEAWRREHAARAASFADRYSLYTFLNRDLLTNGPICYLEFGVFKGKTIKYWAQLNTDRNSRFWGFDTFTGLPDTWDTFTGGLQKGRFDLHGQLPALDDVRISLVKGLFQESLNNFLLTHVLRGTLVIHLDCDLYSSTLYVLAQCNNVLQKDSIIIFDEFSSMLHEFRALEDWCEAYRRRYEVVGATVASDSYFSQIAIRMSS